jgi:hypothetical protein
MLGFFPVVCASAVPEAIASTAANATAMVRILQMNFIVSSFLFFFLPVLQEFMILPISSWK